MCRDGAVESKIGTPSIVVAVTNICPFPISIGMRLLKTDFNSIAGNAVKTLTRNIWIGEGKSRREKESEIETLYTNT